MKRYQSLIVCATAVILIGLVPAWGASDENEPSRGRLIVENALLSGLEGGAVFPFIDTTPSRIRRAHIALTDAAAVCAPGAGAPLNVQVLVGEAGVDLVPVMTAGTNTGISTRPGQCVFHVTIRPGSDGVPSRVTDIVVLNAGDSPLTGIHTVTVSVEVP